MTLVTSDALELSGSLVMAMAGLFPKSVGIACTDAAHYTGPCLLEEAASVRSAVASRRHEFLLGRRCARTALAAIGVAAGAIPRGRDGAPVWPAGVVGSISHCRGFVGAAVARAEVLSGIGFDAEPASPLDDDLVESVCTPAEIAWVGRAPRPAAADWPKILFSAKESIHKCIAPLSGIRLDFPDVTVVVSPTMATFSARLNARVDRLIPDVGRIRGRLTLTRNLVLTAAYMEAR
jgi:4'-phosphopantetheinyl transferase EntD